LPPYFANIKKQIIKSPKLYFTDPALAASLLDNESAKHVKSHPLFGSLFENLVIMEFVKYRFNQGKQSNHYFYQDRTHEIDLVSKISDKLISTEIKSAKTFHESFFRNLDYFESIFQDQLIKKAIVFGGEKSQNRSKASIINPWDITKFSEEFI
jgi:predicted AAA+ superfamily ATPase